MEPALRRLIFAKGRDFKYPVNTRWFPFSISFKPCRCTRFWHNGFILKSAALKESAQKRRRFIRNADNLVRCLTIEFEIQLGRGPAVVPVGKRFELAPPQAPLLERGASDVDAHTRRLP